MPRPPLSLALVELGAWVITWGLLVVRANITRPGVLVLLLVARALVSGWAWLKFQPRFARVYLAGWLLTGLSPIGLALLGWPGPVTAIEALATALAMSGVCLGIAALLPATCDAAWARAPLAARLVRVGLLAVAATIVTLTGLRMLDEPTHAATCMVDGALLLGTTAAAALLIHSWLRRQLTEPLMEIDAALQSIDRAASEPTVRLHPRADDELGRLAGRVNHLFEQLDHSERAVHELARGRFDIALEDAGPLHTALRSLATRLRETEIELQSISASLSRATAELHANASAQDDAVEQQSKRMIEFNMIVDRLALAAADISTVADEVHDNAAQTRDTATSVAAELAKLDAEATGIADLIELIREIANRSDILALNGALEATRAGEAGRGFALVADEMRRLAERVGNAATVVQDRTHRITAAGVQTRSATARGRALADDTVAAAQRISQLTSAQREQTELVADNMRGVADAVTAMVWSTSEAQTIAAQLLASVRALEQLGARFEHDIEGQVATPVASGEPARSR